MPRKKRQARRAKRRAKRASRRAARQSRRIGRRTARKIRRAGRKAIRKTRRAVRRTARGAKRTGRKIARATRTVERLAAEEPEMTGGGAPVRTNTGSCSRVFPSLPVKGSSTLQRPAFDLGPLNAIDWPACLAEVIRPCTRPWVLGCGARTHRGFCVSLPCEARRQCRQEFTHPGARSCAA